MEQKEEKQRERKQHKVGERFEYCKLIYEVRENILCKKCSFFIEAENHCTRRRNHDFEPCNCYERDDKKNVIFVQVGEAND